MLRVDDRLAGVVIRRFARGGEMFGRLGGHNEHFAAGRSDLGQEVGEGREVGRAEGTPVAAEVWCWVLVFGGSWVGEVELGGEVGDERVESSEDERQRRTDDLDKFVVGDSMFVLGDWIGRVRCEDHFGRLLIDVEASWLNSIDILRFPMLVDGKLKVDICRNCRRW